ncbi:hypothetical protein BR93DRAFT_992167 [Coniochaeta sp. PMI_546]|nr:hypothetical protein BR93DRAFT_992167 [Coniochaeta sp. PMI_546]
MMDLDQDFRGETGHNWCGTPSVSVSDSDGGDRSSPCYVCAGNVRESTGINPGDSDSCHEEAASADDDEMESRQPDEVLEGILRIYETGTPFFTKAAMRDIVQQVKALDGRPGHVIITDLTATVVRQHVAGDVHSQRKAEQTTFRLLPVLRYNPVNHLYLNARYPTHFDKKAAYLPISLSSVRCSSPVSELGDNTFASILEVVQPSKATWQASQHVEMLQGLLDLSPIPPIDKIVGFACSTMEMYKDCYSTCDQLAFLPVLRDILARRGYSDISCYVQDPTLTETHARDLQCEGITVLHDPEGFLELDENTAVVSLTPIQPVRQIITDITRPAMMIWPKGDNRIVDVKKYRADIDDPSSPRVARMLQEEYVELPWPKIEFEPKQQLAVYIRKQCSNSASEVESMDIQEGHKWL